MSRTIAPRSALPVWAEVSVYAEVRGRKRGHRLGHWGDERVFEIRAHTLVHKTRSTGAAKVYDLRGARVERSERHDDAPYVATLVLGSTQHGRGTVDLALESEEALSSLAAAVERVSQVMDVERRMLPLRTIGQGSWGKVMLMRDTRFVPHAHSHPEVFAVKEIAVRSSMDPRQLTTERAVLSAVPKHRNIIGLWFTARRPGFVYYGMEFAAGGDLFSLMANKRILFSEAQARFYAAEVLLALQHLHEHNIIYRDLKPENILLSIDGHVKLGDMGMAKKLLPSEATLTLCGTAPYVPPEMILGASYREEVDFWQYGCFVYELTRGRSPFHRSTQEQIRESILGISYVRPKSASADYLHFLSTLLEGLPQRRLRSWATLRTHNWFLDINWIDAENGALVPPVLPTGSLRVTTVDLGPKQASFSTRTDSETTSAFSRSEGPQHNLTMDELAETLKNFDEDAVQHMEARFAERSYATAKGEDAQSRYLLGFDWISDAMLEGVDRNAVLSVLEAQPDVDSE
jgi:serine/threonine protein kinase